MVHGTDAFTHLTGFLLDGLIICGGRVGFLNLTVEMLLVSAARLNFEGIKGVVDGKRLFPVVRGGRPAVP